MPLPLDIEACKMCGWRPELVIVGDECWTKCGYCQDFRPCA